MKRRIITALLGMALAVTALTGCGGNDAANNASTEASQPADSAAADTATADAGEEKKAPEMGKLPHGTLTYLNFTEEDCLNLNLAEAGVKFVLADEGYLKDSSILGEKPEGKPEDMGINPQLKYYDNLNSMLMALESGEIEAIDGLPQTTAMYLCSQDDSLFIPLEFDMSKILEDDDSFGSTVFHFIGNGFSFMMLEDRTDLKDEFDNAITAMKEDGTIDKLREDYIITPAKGGEIKPVDIEKVDGRDTITVAVTGDLPPMDFVAADGSFAGYNTAVLAEIGKRLDKNIELVQVESAGRSSALVSGVADVTFWTRTSFDGVGLSNMTEEERKEFIEKKKAGYNEAEAAAMEAYANAAGEKAIKKRTMDIPEGTITTLAYFNDIPAMVVKK